MQTAKDKEQSYIIGLTKDSLSAQELENYQSLCNDKGVVFAATTYTDLVHLLRGQAKDHETDLIEIIDDYEQFLLSEDMIAKPFRMLCVACGTSFYGNIKYQLYYEPTNRPDKAKIPFIGIYRKKTITHIGRIKLSVIATYKDKKLNIEGAVKISDLEKERICQIIESAPYYPNLGPEPHRYYIIEDLMEVNLIKTSPVGIMAIRYFDLQEDFSDTLKINMTMEQIADIIKDKTFE